MRLFVKSLFFTLLTIPLMAQNTILFTSATAIAAKIRNKEVTSYEVVTAYYEQIDKYNHTYNAVVTPNKTEALKRAKEADIAISKGEIWGKLQGVSITLKDNYKTKGLRTTSGYKPLTNNVPDTDAEIVKLLISEGAIIIGKTNLSVLAMDMQSDNPIFGKTSNP